MLRFRVHVSTVVTLLLLQAVALLLYLNWHIFLPPQTSDSNSSSGGKVHVLLLSSWRSGSSFLGQVFNRHPSVFYLMEPAWHVWTRIQRPGASSLRMAVRDLMHRVFLCDLSVMDAYMQPHYNVSHLFMWSHSRALCSPPVCPVAQDQKMEPGQCMKLCTKTAAFEQTESSCQSHSHVVLKEVRFFELESLYPLLRDPSLDLRIVHLVRDPRAVFRSRMKSAQALGRDTALVLEREGKLPDDAQRLVMQEVCRSHVRIYDTAMHKPPDFLRGRYKIVRYEDIVRDPLEEIKRIYDFVGLEMTEQLMDWIYHVTHGTGQGAKAAFQITARNAMDVAQAWRTSLPFASVQKIQDVCKSAMSLLGYQAVNDEEEQNQLELDLTQKEKYSFTWRSSSRSSTSVNNH